MLSPGSIDNFSKAPARNKFTNNRTDDSETARNSEASKDRRESRRELELPKRFHLRSTVNTEEITKVICERI